MSDRNAAAALPAARSQARRPHAFCTYFDVNYLGRGLALWRSLKAASPDAVLWVCCLDAATRAALERLALPDLRIFTLEELERRFPDLAAAKPTRSRIEYYFTCTASVVRYVLDAAPALTQITYIDADLYFFADPEPLFAELGAAGGAVGIIAHRFPPRLRERERYGLYNVGWLTFVRDRRGLACLEDWRRRCIEWCYFREEDGKFADQKYLDDWPRRFDGTVVLGHSGANVALWNLEGAAVSEQGGKVLLDGKPLLFFHFHGLKPLRPWLFRTDAASYGMRLSAAAQRLIYAPHLRCWSAMARLAGAPGGPPRAASNGPAGRALRWVRDMLRGAHQAVTGRGEYLMVWPWLPARFGAAPGVARSGSGETVVSDVDGTLG